MLLSARLLGYVMLNACFHGRSVSDVPCKILLAIPSIIKPFIIWIKSRDGYVDDSHPAYCTVTTAGLDEDARHWPDRH